MIISVNKKLVEFLNEENALKKFIVNASTMRFDIVLANSIGLIDLKIVIKSMTEAFVWKDSPEGFNYWYNLNRKFKENEKFVSSTQFFSHN